MEDIKWWGYLHEDGTVQVKRYFDHRDIEEALASDFVQSVTPPYPADSRDHAIEIAERLLKGAVA